MPKRRVIAWFGKLQKLAGNFVDELLRDKLGSEGDIIEMDKCQVGKRKPHKGRRRREVWVLCAVVRGSMHREGFVQTVKNRKRETLTPIILERINSNVEMLVTDGWASYEGLMAHGFNHKSVNHSENFVHQANPQVHTQSIESYWKQLRDFLNKKHAYRRKHLKGFLKEFFFRNKAADPFENIISIIGREHRF